MITAPKPTPEEIRRARSDNPSMRERDLAQKLGISEADYVAALCGEGVTRLVVDVNAWLAEMEGLGEVMALTRNESAVHEKIGVYDKVHPGEQAAMVLGSEIDLRIFPSRWAHGFAVEKRGDDGVRHSLQFFDPAGDAVHKVHLRPNSNLYAYQRLVEKFGADDQSRTVNTVRSPGPKLVAAKEAANRNELRAKWEAMTDVHQFFGILRALNLTRHEALAMAGDDLAWRLEADAVATMMHRSVEEQIPIMCFVGNDGCIQIHSGPITNVRPMGPWINVMDPTFHLHLRLDHIREVWAVRKPNTDGHVTSLEAYDANRNMVIQFFGKRHEGHCERSDWRSLAEQLPRIPNRTAA